jgi:hypothetical protein
MMKQYIEEVEEMVETSLLKRGKKQKRGDLKGSRNGAAKAESTERTLPFDVRGLLGSY